MSTTQWKFLNIIDNKLTSLKDWSSIWEIGEWKTCKEEPVIGKAGYHSSNTIPEAQCNGVGLILAQVECDGKYMESDNRFSWEKMRILKAWHIQLDVLDKFVVLALEESIKEHPFQEIKIATIKELLFAYQDGTLKFISEWISMWQNYWWIHLRSLSPEINYGTSSLQILVSTPILHEIWINKLLPTLKEFNNKAGRIEGEE